MPDPRPAASERAELNAHGARGQARVLRTHIASLRRKIEPAGGARYIRTDSGVGYRFVA